MLNQTVSVWSAASVSPSSVMIAIKSLLAASLTILLCPFIKLLFLLYINPFSFFFLFLPFTFLFFPLFLSFPLLPLHSPFFPLFSFLYLYCLSIFFPFLIFPFLPLSPFLISFPLHSFLFLFFPFLSSPLLLTLLCNLSVQTVFKDLINSRCLMCVFAESWLCL